MHSNVGRVFVDLSSEVYPTYAVGERGFIYLRNIDGPVGDFIAYDSAFSGPEFFDHVSFIECRVDW